MPNLVTSTVGDGNMSFYYGDKAEVINNRLEFLTKQSIDSEQAVIADLEGADKVVVVGPDDKGLGMYDLESAPKCDGLVTIDSGVVLVMYVADCYVVLLTDMENSVWGLGHFGWKGANSDLGANIVSAMITQGAEPANIQVQFSPGIAADSYVWDQANNLDPLKWAGCLKGSNNGVGIDIQCSVANQLIALGIAASAITYSQIDTFTDRNYFSHRRSAQTNEPEGRFMVAVTMK